MPMLDPERKLARLLHHGGVPVEAEQVVSCPR